LAYDHEIFFPDEKMAWGGPNRSTSRPLMPARRAAYFAKSASPSKTLKVTG
jgi:hypothetical protein